MNRKYDDEFKRQAVKKVFDWQSVVERLVEFTKGDYRLIIQFAGQLQAELGWDYAIALSPLDYWKEMVF